MRLIRYLQHWLSGTGPRLHVVDFVPDTHPLRQWADTFPWTALVAAVEQSFAQRFPTRSPRGRAPVPIRVLLALELLKHALGAADEDICHRLRTDFAVMDACGLREYQAPRSQVHFVLPETLCEFRGRIDEALMDARIAIQAAAAMEARWQKVLSARPISSSIPSRVSKAANGSRMPPPSTRLKKNSRTHRAHHRTVLPPSSRAPEPRPQPPTGADKGHAVFWPPMPGARPCLREVGTPNRTATP